MSAKVPASRKIKSTTGHFFSIFCLKQEWYYCTCKISMSFNCLKWYLITFYSQIICFIRFLFIFLAFTECAAAFLDSNLFSFFFFSASVFNKTKVWDRSERKGGRGGKSTGGPGWGHGHTCRSLRVIYCPEPRQQSVEFKEICNEKFLIQRPKALAGPCLLPLSLLHAINTDQAHQITGHSNDLCLYSKLVKSL